MAARTIGTSWWVDFRFNHIRYRKRSPENSRAGALAYEAVLRQKLMRGERIEEELIEAPTFEAFARKWFDVYVVANNKISEQRGKTYVLNGSLFPFFGRMRIDSIGTHHVEQYKAAQLKRGVSRKTVNNRLSVLNKCITTAYEWLPLKGAPPKIVWLKCTSLRTDHLSPDESRMLLSATDGIVREMALVALHTGMRQGEIRGLQWSSIDWQGKSITVRHSRSDFAKALDTPKNHRVRYIPISLELQETLAKRKQPDGYVFLDAGKPFTSKRITDELAVACRRAGLRPTGWHTLRHTFASQLAMKGVPLSAVQALLGHSTITMTMRYAHLAPSTLRTAIDVLTDSSPTRAFGQDMGNGPPRRATDPGSQKSVPQEYGVFVG